MANVTFMEHLNGIVSQAEHIESLAHQLSEALSTLSRMSNDLVADTSSVRILCAINENAVSEIANYQNRLSEMRIDLNLDTRCKYAKFLADDAINYRSVMEAVTAEILKEEST